jgi:NADPH-dependent glutamate synthase beta subunit-like oxidoreductase
MPLAQPPDNATPDQVAKTEQVRQKMLKLARDRYLFRFQERRLTTGLVVENGRLAGLKVVETKIEGRKADPVPGSEHELRAPLIVSSIGSVPEKVPGLAMKGEYITFTGEDLPRYTAMDRVFGVGNVVTGQGNIRVSLVHSQKVTKHLIDNRIKAGSREANVSAAEKQVAGEMQAIEQEIDAIPPLSDQQRASLEKHVHSLQEKVGYTADYDSWLAKVTPPDLE